MSYKDTILHLSLLEGLGPSFIQKLVNKIGLENVQDMYHFSEQDLIHFGLTQERAHVIVIGLKNQDLLNKELELIAEHKVQLITLWCPEYPYHLKQIDVPPIVLYVQGGDLSLFSHEKMLACVGSRLAHSYVQDCLQKIVAPMIQDGWVIVSGGAAGADTYAHKLAVQLGGKTVVVVGSGLCYQYPNSNKPLFKQIVEQGGLMVSCFPMQTEPLPHCFPIRNRIISGLSVGCLVLQAAAKSGALITAQYALDQGREVFAIPGPIYDPLSAGCHELIQQGAKLVTCTQDIIQELVPYACVADKQESFIAATTSKDESGYDAQEQLILQWAVTPVSLDDLLLKLDIEPKQLHEKLFMLTLQGKIKQDDLGLWKRL